MLHLTRIKNYIAECLDRISITLLCVEHYTMAEYQRWFDQNPEYHNGAVAQISPLELFNTKGLMIYIEQIIG